MKNILFNQYIYFKKEGIQNAKESLKFGIMYLYVYGTCIIYGICGGYGYFS